jgi:amino acid adenylation domain-containing protein
MDSREIIESVYPLSYMQEGMLFHELNAPGSGINTEQVVCDLHEALDANTFRKAWQRMVERHPIFRTSFHWVGYSKPVQKVHRHVDILWETKDWRNLSDEEQEIQFRKFLETDCKLGFNTSQAPVSRWTLFHLSDKDYRLVWSFDHVLLDARSFTFILTEVFTLYEGLKLGQAIELDPLRPYEDYVQWLKRRDLKSGETFWREQLKGFTAPTPICPHRCDIGRKSDEVICGRLEARFSSEVTQRLKNLAAQNDFTLNTVVQGAWALLLSRYSREEDVVFGVVRACRRSSFEGVDSVVGLLINTLPMRLQIHSDQSLIPWLKGLRLHQILQREYEHSPLIEVQRWSDVPRGTPLFESIIVFENYDLNTKLQNQGGVWKQRDFRLLELTKFPITLYAFAGEELKLEMGYQVARCDEGTANGFLEHLKTALEWIAQNPHQQLGELPLLTAGDQKKFQEWNNTKTPYPEDTSIHRLFEAQVERTPDSVALVFRDRSITYRELNDRANQLASHLRIAGVGPEVMVGICVERSLEMVIGLLGILKAGGAYVPLDPAYPPERLAFMVSDTQAPPLVLQERFLELFPDLKSKVVILERDWDVISKESKDNVPSGTTAENLAYVIYTSGSTGKPKGVMIEHRNVVNLFIGMDACIEHGPESTWLAVTSPSFDISVLEIFWTLARGFRVVIYSGDENNFEENEDHAYSIPNLIKHYKVTHFQCTPSMAGMLMLDEEARKSFGQLQILLIGGETLPSALAAELQKVVGGDILNMYGPTETTVWSTTYKLNEGKQNIPIGRPIANTTIHIMDENRQLVPVGVPGELVIGGAGVVRGYLKRPELTEERFIRNPFSSDHGGKLYRTGDLVRYLLDGNIEFMGRMDQQVKILGHRIELGEIETVLNEHPAVQESVVIVREDVPGHKRLVAYVIPREGKNLSLGELRNHAKEKLPGYMVPAHVVTLKAFPKTPNKKIDRKALSLPANDRNEQRTSFDPPRSEIEEAVAAIWAEALGLNEVGRNENFFELGGNSLSACGVVLSIQHTCNVDLPLQTIFRAPTVAALTAKLEEVFRKQIDSIDVGTMPPPEEDRAGLEVPFEPPRTPTEKDLAILWAKILRINRVSRNDHFFRLGGKSLDAVKLFSEIEKKFGKKLPLSALLQAPTLVQLSNILQDSEWEPKWSPVVPIQPTGVRLPFFCIHAHRGNVLNYYPLAHYLGSDQPFYGIQARGLDGDRVSFRTFKEMAVDYLKEVRSVQPEGPYVIGGWCMGGYIALEMAHLLESAGEEVALLALIDTPHPNYLKLSSRTTVFHRILYKLLERIDYEVSVVKALSPKERLPHLRKKANALIPPVQAFTEKLVEIPLNKLQIRIPHSQVYRLQGLYDMHDKAFHEYDPRPYDGRVVLFRSRTQTHALNNDPFLGWKGLFNGELKLCEIPGHYINILIEPSVRLLADELKNCLQILK